MSDFSKLLKKYDVPVPRYTSFPAILNWKNNLTTEEWLKDLATEFESPNTDWSLYFHLPFCESLCTFCACNNIITRDHSKEDQYIEALHREWSIYVDNIPAMKKANLRQIHLGGGSPTFFQPEHLRKILTPMLNSVTKNEALFEGAVEVDPRRCKKEHLNVLRELGFNRISLGVQDFDFKVQNFVNRVQPYEMVEQCVSMAREMGYRSTNFDLIYGLPGQTQTSMKDTALKTLQLKPERIALYSMAIVPWIKPAQKRFKDEDLPKGQEKRDLYELARAIFLSEGYIEIGIDHFALPTDPLALAYKNETLHRNFMGYTEYSTDILLGLGVSAISESKKNFHQNNKSVNSYYELLDKMTLPTERTHRLSEQELLIRRQILDLMTKQSIKIEGHNNLEKSLNSMIEDDLVKISDGILHVTPVGRTFVRNICAELDPYFQKESSVKQFSSGI